MGKIIKTSKNKLKSLITKVNESKVDNENVVNQCLVVDESNAEKDEYEIGLDGDLFGGGYYHVTESLNEIIVDKRSKIDSNGTTWFVLYRGDLLFFDYQNRTLLDDFFHKHINELSNFVYSYEQNKFKMNREFNFVNFIDWIGSLVPYLISGYVNGSTKTVYINRNEFYDVLNSNELFQLVKKMPNYKFVFDGQDVNTDQIIKNKGKKMPDVFYHGTTFENALEILGSGLRAKPENSLYKIKHDKTVFLSSNFKQAKWYANYKNRRSYGTWANSPCVLKIDGSKVDNNKFVYDYDVYNAHTTKKDDLTYNERMKDFGLKYDNTSLTITKPSDPRKYMKFGYRGIIRPNAIVSVYLVSYDGDTELSKKDFVKYIQENYMTSKNDDLAPLDVNESYNVSVRGDLDSINTIEFIPHENAREEGYEDDEIEDFEPYYEVEAMDMNGNTILYADLTVEELFDYFPQSIINDIIERDKSNATRLSNPSINQYRIEDILYRDTTPSDVGNVDEVNRIAKKIQTGGPSAYLLTDGDIIYFHDHIYINNIDGITPDKFIALGNIRLGNGGFELIKEPTRQQMYELKQWIRQQEGGIYVDFCEESHQTYPRTLFSTKYGSPNPDRIINDIYYYFDNNIKPQGNMFMESLVLENSTDRRVNKIISQYANVDDFQEIRNIRSKILKFIPNARAKNDMYLGAVAMYYLSGSLEDEEDRFKLNYLLRLLHEGVRMGFGHVFQKTDFGMVPFENLKLLIDRIIPSKKTVSSYDNSNKKRRVGKYTIYRLDSYEDAKFVGSQLSETPFCIFNDAEDFNSMTDGCTTYLCVKDGYSSLKMVTSKQLIRMLRKNGMGDAIEELKYEFDDELYDFDDIVYELASIDDSISEMIFVDNAYELGLPPCDDYGLSMMVVLVPNVSVTTTRIGYVYSRYNLPNMFDGAILNTEELSQVIGADAKAIFTPNKTMEKSGVQEGIIRESQESKSISAAKKLVMQKLGYNEQQANEFIRVKLRNNIPTLRTPQGGKFILGVTRMFCDGELRSANDIGNLNSTLKLVASDAHINEYDRNLNGMSCQELIQRFAKAMSDNLDAEKDEINQMAFDTPSDYEIVRIDSFEQAEEYGDYVSWCVTHDGGMFDSYTNDGFNQFYFCLKNGFENVEEVQSEGCPLDEYGLSMIAVSVNENGMLNTCTCRWNHDNGGDDSIMNAKEVSQVIGMNFFEVFKPNNKWKDLLTSVMQRLANGEDPRTIFDYVGDFCEGFAVVKINNKWNCINQEGRILSDQWFDYVGDFCEGFAKVNLNNKYNFINQKGRILSNQWFDYIGPFREGFARVELNGKVYKIDTSGNLALIESNKKNGELALYESRSPKNVIMSMERKNKKTVHIRESALEMLKKIELKENFNFEVDSSDVDLSSFEKQEELAPSLWRNGVLNPRARLKLLDIADDFWEFVNITWVKPKSILLTGSICNFNWSQYSDIDLHLVVDFSEIDDKKEFVKEYLDSKKNEWNDKHDSLTIYGFNVELYTQDIDEGVESGGIYDLEENEWVREPNKSDIHQLGQEMDAIKSSAAKIMTIIDDMYDAFISAEDQHVIDEIGDDADLLWRKVKEMRKSSLAKDGEMSDGNITYKVLRRTKYLDKLFNLKTLVYDKVNSITESTNHNNEYLFNAAKKRFGVTNDVRECGYILPDGSMLDFSGRHIADPNNRNIGGGRPVDHRSIIDMGWDEEFTTPTDTPMTKEEFVSLGAIRVDFNQGYAEMVKRPTREQEMMLLRFAKYNDGWVTVEINKGGGNSIYGEYEDANPRRVVADIIRYFDEGINTLGNIQQENAEKQDNLLKEYLDKDHNMELYRYFDFWSNKATSKDKAEDIAFTCPYGIKNAIEHLHYRYHEFDDLLDEDGEFNYENEENINKFIELLEKYNLCDFFISDANQIVDYYMLPAWMFVDFIGVVKNEWCIHFGNDASEIAKEGFTDGTLDVNDLAYTSAGQRKSTHGYNFAYRLSERNVDRNNYGNEAVIFRTSGVEIYHYGDNENQVIFWGPNVKELIPIEYNKEIGEWVVYGHKGQILKSGKPSDIAYWATENLPQYRKQILNGKSGFIPKHGVWDRAENKYKYVPTKLFRNESIRKYLKMLKESSVIEEEAVMDGSANGNPYKERWDAERQALKDFICHHGVLMQSREDNKGGKLYKCFYDRGISNLIGYGYCLCVQWDSIKQKPKSVVYIRAWDKFSPNIKQVTFDDRGMDNTRGTADDLNYGMA